MERLSWHDWCDKVVSEGFGSMVFLKDLLESGKVTIDDWKASVSKNLEEHGHAGKFNLEMLNADTLNECVCRSGWYAIDRISGEKEAHEQKIQRKAENIMKPIEALAAKREKEKREVADLVAKRKALLAARQRGAEPFKKPKVVVVRKKTY